MLNSIPSIRSPGILKFTSPPFLLSNQYCCVHLQIEPSLYDADSFLNLGSSRCITIIKYFNMTNNTV